MDLERSFAAFAEPEIDAAIGRVAATILDGIGSARDFAVVLASRCMTRCADPVAIFN